MANGTAIVQHTLPTLVGMGVVAKTTETMFGGRRKRKTAKRATRHTTGRKSKSTIPKTRKFDDKVYRLANTHTTKAAAERDAQYFRKAGHSARVVHVGGKWVVYTR